MEDAWRRTRLLGRERERDALDRLLDDVKAERGSVLVVRGEAGVGKTELLGYLAEASEDCTVVRCTGVESEMELPYAGLHQVCVPLLSHLDALPEPQRDALATAFGLRSGEAGTPFLVGLAVLSLLAEAACDRPLVCLLDDAQWLDRTSARLLAFVARRLLAEPIAMVFAVRSPHVLRELEGLPELMLTGLDEASARALLDGVTPGKLDEHVRDRIVAETRGNPLALLELPRGLSVAELAGGFARPDAPPLAGRIEQSFLQRARRLPVETQRLLLVAAAEPVGDLSLLWKASRSLGIGGDAAAPARADGLIELGMRLRFCHPLARSAIYRAADATERNEVHLALADATDPDVDPDRRAWHRAQATTEPDEDVAGELERSAERARVRGGNAAAAAFLRRATELTPSAGRRAGRALAAARASYAAGALEDANALLGAAELGPLDDLGRARLQRLHAQITFARTRGPGSSRSLLDAASRLLPFSPALARETTLEAFAAALFTGRFDGTRGLRAVAEAVPAAPSRPDASGTEPSQPEPPQPEPSGTEPSRTESSRPIDLLLAGLATRFTEGNAAAVAPLRRALEAFERAAERADDPSTPWLWLAWFVAGDLWDSHWWSTLAQRSVVLAREAGALNFLPVCLEGAAAARLHAGAFSEAAALIQESDSMSEATGNAPLRYCSLVLAAWRGEEANAIRMIEARTAEANASGEGRVIGLVGYVTAVLYNGLGRYDAAMAAARRGVEHDDLELCGFALVELVEASVRCGAMDVARDAMQRLALRTVPANTDWARGVEARSRALLTAGDEAEAHYRTAIASLERSGVAVHEARAHLLYGEWLRRENRRLDARGHLRTAYEMLARFGAVAFAERARREIVASGENARKRSPETRDLLTPQELQIARLAADNQTNPEIGGQLFISPRTVEYHLHKVFAKLNIGSRRELDMALRGVE